LAALWNFKFLLGFIRLRPTVQAGKGGLFTLYGQSRRVPSRMSVIQPAVGSCRQAIAQAHLQSQRPTIVSSHDTHLTLQIFVSTSIYLAFAAATGWRRIKPIWYQLLSSRHNILSLNANAASHQDHFSRVRQSRVYSANSTSLTAVIQRSLTRRITTTAKTTNSNFKLHNTNNLTNPPPRFKCNNPNNSSKNPNTFQTLTQGQNTAPEAPSPQRQETAV